MTAEMSAQLCALEEINENNRLPKFYSAEGVDCECTEVIKAVNTQFEGQRAAP